ncbi:hypothetical protein C8A00DRAFT_18455, partial [Chaetomidium leptoderma]
SPKTPPPLTPETLKLLLATFDRALPDTTRYAVSGHAALMVWGYYYYSPRNTTPSHVSIVCPAADRDVILTRARAVGWSVSYPYRGDGEVVISGVPVPVLGLTGEEEVVVWGVIRLRVVRDGEGGVWGRLGWVRPVEMVAGTTTTSIGMESSVCWVWTEAPVMGVPTLLDEFARAWYFCVVKKRGRGDGGGEREKRIGEMILWCLWRLAEDAEVNGGEGRWKWTPRDVPCLVYGKFWYTFVRRYPWALGLLEMVGLSGPGFAIRKQAATVASGDT